MSSPELETPQVKSQQRARRGQRRNKIGRQRGVAEHGKRWVLVIFLALRLIDGLLILALGYQSQLLVSIGMTALWTTVLLIAIWRGQNWARYILIALLLLSVVVFMIALPAALTAPTAGAVPTIGPWVMVGLAAGGLLQGLIVWCLVASADIKRLTNRFLD